MPERLENWVSLKVSRLASPEPPGNFCRAEKLKSSEKPDRALFSAKLRSSQRFFSPSRHSG